MGENWTKLDVQGHTGGQTAARDKVDLVFGWVLEIKGRRALEPGERSGGGRRVKEQRWWSREKTRPGEALDYSFIVAQSLTFQGYATVPFALPCNLTPRR